MARRRRGLDRTEATARVANQMARDGITIKHLRKHAEEHRMMKKLGIQGVKGMAKRRRRSTKRRKGGLKGTPRLSTCKSLSVELDTGRSIRDIGRFPATKKGWERAKGLAKRRGRGGATAIVSANGCRDKSTGRSDTLGAYICSRGHCEMNQPFALSGTKRKRRKTKTKRRRKLGASVLETISGTKKRKRRKSPKKRRSLKGRKPPKRRVKRRRKRR